MKVSANPAKQRTEVRQASLIAAALLLAAQRSPADVTTGDLARAVGITQGAVFRHFASKEAIWLAVLDWVTEALMTRLQAAAQDAQEAESEAIKIPPTSGESPSTMVALRALFMAHVNFVVEYPGVPRVIFQELQSPGDTALKARVRSLMQRYRQLLMRFLQQAQAQKVIAPDTDLHSAAVLFIGSVQGLVMQSLIAAHASNMALHAPGVFAIYQRGLQTR